MLSSHFLSNCTPQGNSISRPASRSSGHLWDLIVLMRIASPTRWPASPSVRCRDLDVFGPWFWGPMGPQKTSILELADVNRGLYSMRIWPIHVNECNRDFATVGFQVTTG